MGIANPARADYQFWDSGVERHFQIAYSQTYLHAPGLTEEKVRSCLAGSGIHLEYAVGSEFILDSGAKDWKSEWERQSFLEKLFPNAEVEAILYEDGIRLKKKRAIVSSEILIKANSSEEIQSWSDRSKVKAIQPASVSGYYLVEFLHSLDALQEGKRLVEMGKSAMPMLRRVVEGKFAPNDPYFQFQWNLDDTGQVGAAANADINIQKAWDVTRGQGVVVAVVDDGLQTTHPDLSANCAPIDSNANTSLNYDFLDNDTNPAPVPSHGDNHGTMVAGVLAARDNNGIGLAGVAPESTLVGIRIDTNALTDQQIANAFSWRKDKIAISNNSWGPPDDGQLYGFGPLGAAAIQDAATNGRGGKGVVFVFAGGNGLQSNDNANYNSYVNSIYSIAVAATDNQAKQASYSEPGACLLISAPSGGGSGSIYSTDLTGGNGTNTGGSSDLSNLDYTKNFGGTSASAPEVSGVVALMLAVNSNLTWRDVQEILIATAQKNDSGDSDWVTNSAGYHFNHKYGAGLLDATAAVTKAQSWSNLGSQNQVQVSQSINQNIPDNSNTGVTQKFDFSSQTNLRVEHVQVSVNITHPHRGQLQITVTSPSGTKSVLAEPHGDNGANFNWSFTTVHNWGENSQGMWSVTVKDLVAGSTGTWNNATITLYGSGGSSGGGGGSQVGFESSTASVNENAGSISLNVNRSGSTNGTVSVDYSTSDGSAANGQNYQGQSGTLTFGSGETQKTIQIPILDDGQHTGTQTFSVSLSNLRGNATLAQTQETVSIIDTDSSPDSAKPSVSISSPGSNAKLISLPITITGKASDNQQVSEVDYQIGQGTSFSDWQTADGTTNWTVTLNDLPPGLNTIRVKSVDGAGNESSIVSRSFNFSPSGPLTVEINGNGMVSPGFEGTSTRTLGSKYTIQAYPASGYVFDGWSGSTNSMSNPMTFVMSDQLDIQANFIPNPFIPVKGTYYGLVTNDSIDFSSTGSFKITTGSTSSFSGSLRLGKSSYSFSGKFTNQGDWSGTISRGATASPLQITLHLDVTDGTNQVTGSISDSDDTFTSSISSDRVTYTTFNPSPHTGKYTMLFLHDTNRTDAPEGDGVATMNVSASGIASVAVRLGDGTTTSFSNPVTQNDELSIYASLYSSGGSILGKVVFEDNPGISDFDGTVVWAKPARPMDRFYSDGFSTSLNVIGSSYTPIPSGTVMLNFPDPPSNAVFIFQGSDLDSTLERTVTFDSSNHMTVDDPSAGTLTLSSFNSSTGLFSGSFFLPSANAKAGYWGVLFQKQNSGNGYYLGVHQTGSVILQANQ